MITTMSSEERGTMTLKPQHPLHQIATTPTHKLLLKQWLKEQELILTRISHKETQIDSVRKELTTLYTIFFTFHSLSLTLLFASSSGLTACSRMWVPALVSVLFSVGIVWAVRYKTDVEGHFGNLLEREREDKRLLEKCVDELKRKGCEFDLLKEVDALRRAKSLKVGAGVSVKKWTGKDLVSMFLLGTSCCVVGFTRMVLCG